ncbi:pilus assembly protein [Catenulispora sp. NL8]|uniref:Pilus assembly protein n=1 Tax=Catenulispora pinistramenti TaxID=2705254 RepID=A0ABS5KN66_9ACTN|nr:TadE family protein [Catenulispora pinistramenti]MBS2547449.1 pilus assembly protein [Catenulispora pinistramenti]
MTRLQKMPPTRSGRALTSRTADDGSSTVEMVVITPVMLLVLMVIVQFAVYFCALHVAQAAAAQAAAGTSSEHGKIDNGTSEAHRILGTVGAGFLTATDVAVTRSATLTTVRISGTVATVVPFLHLKVSSVARTPNEALTTAAAS